MLHPVTHTQILTEPRLDQSPPPHPALPEYGTQGTTPGGIRYKIQMGSGCVCGKIQLTRAGEIYSIESPGGYSVNMPLLKNLIISTLKNIYSLSIVIPIFSASQSSL
jgi:hypothetical protein